jgi:hypothetical protein
VWLLFFVVVVGISLGVPGCSDEGDTVTPTPTEDPVTANRQSVNLAPGQSTVVIISGGRPPYGITTAPNSSVATASLGDPNSSPVNLTISALASAIVGSNTSVSVGDADELEEGGGMSQRVAHGENEVTIQINITATGGMSFAGDIQPIFTDRCATSGCHAGTTPQSGMSLEAGEAYANIVNVNATGTTCAGQKRVDPGSSASSVLYNLVNGTSCGGRMPFSFGGTDSLTSDQQDAIRDWIDQGAENN